MIIAVKIFVSIVFVALAAGALFWGMFAPMMSDAPDNAPFATRIFIECGIVALVFIALTVLVWAK